MSKEKIVESTWGHLALSENVEYKGRIVFATPTYGRHGHEILLVDFPEIADSPWFYQALHDWLFIQYKTKEYDRDGVIYEFTGVCRNYEFDGKINILLDLNKKS